MVVIIIIGILVGFLLPAIGGALRRSKEFTIQTEMKQLVGAIEKFKSDHLYPIDFRDPTIINSFVNKLAPNHRYGDVANGWYLATLPNPHPGGPATRSPSTIGPDEVIPFMLGEITNNQEYPFGVYFDGTNWLLDPSGTPNRVFDFDDERLTDLDGDGWFEYVPPNSPPRPYCFFDARSYNDAINAGTITLIDLIYTGLDDSGSCFPYADFQATAANGGTVVYEEAQKFQIICAGMDGIYGKAAVAAGIRYSKNDDAGLTFPHRDNLVSFRDGRLDAGFVSE